MFKTKFTRQSVKRVGSGLVATAIALAASLAPATAMAAPPGWVRVTGNELRVIMPDGTQYFAYTAYPPDGCFTINVDLFKEWQSMAQAALLGGRSIGIGYGTCGSSSIRIITNIEIS
jgi:hypothetical protein